jgi:hypothetical protein
MKGNKPSRKKVAFSVSKPLQSYLEKYGRITDLPIQYEDMGRYFTSVSLLDQHGKDTLWETVYYHEAEKEEIDKALCKIYALLKTDGDIGVIEHLQISRIDYCTFGNTKPFRVRIMNKLNDNYDHFYVKRIDASRVYGLELEHVLSPNRVTYLIDGATLIEEHIAGIPGDFFVENNLEVSEFNQIRIAKEFVKFTERCFVQLLGDMRSYNYIIDITPDIEGNQYRIRAIDFDQQSYEGRKKFYMPQYFKENNPIIHLGLKFLTPESVKQYQLEERSLIAMRARTSSVRLNRLLRVMKKDTISEEKKVNQLKQDLIKHHKAKEFKNCKNMGEIVYKNIELVLQKEFKQSILGAEN